VEKPDHIQVHPVTQCEYCQASLEEVAAVGQVTRQVFSLPPVRVGVTEHQAEIKQCPYCGALTQAPFPAGVTEPAQYGDRLKLQGVYLNQNHHVPLARTREFLENLYGHAPSEAVILATCQELEKETTPVHEAAKDYLMHTVEPVHCDETGLRVVGKLHWVHVTSTKQVTYLELHAKRGQAALDAINLPTPSV
jgi:transposase